MKVTVNSPTYTIGELTEVEVVIILNALGATPTFYRGLNNKRVRDALEAALDPNQDLRNQYNGV